MSKKKGCIYKKGFIYFMALFIIVAFIFYFILPTFFPSAYKISDSINVIKEPPRPVIIHIPTPKPVKAIYMTACVAGTPSFRDKLVAIATSTEINSVVIDIKDYTGTITFNSDHPKFKDNLGGGCKVRDFQDFVRYMHEHNIYVIGRISTFQDKFLVSKRSDLAVKKNSDKTAIWKDYKGVSWLDAGSKEVWDYVIDLAKETYAIGVDELNFDYIRFPSDGNMKDIYYPFSDSKVKAEVMKEFFSYLKAGLADIPAPLSADLFGMTTTNTDDLNIGQILENAIPYFDYIAPMVYPSHYPPTFQGFKNPAEHPYEIIKYSMQKAVDRMNVASTTPLKLRPWLQDFSLGADYTADMVRAQIQATYDIGLDSWMLWDAGNTYTVGALLKE